MTFSAATEPRASCVRPPHDCATGSALVLKCVCMKQHPKFFLCRFWNHFSLLLLFKGVGPRRITVRTGCLGLNFWVLSTNWHGIMCIMHHATSLINKIERECSWENLSWCPFFSVSLSSLKLTLMSFLSKIPHQIENLSLPKNLLDSLSLRSLELLFFVKSYYVLVSK